MESEPEGLPTAASENKADQKLLKELQTDLSKHDVSITGDQKQEFLAIFRSYLDVVSRGDFDLGRYPDGEHTIETEGRPIKLKSRPIPAHHRNEVKKIIEKNLEQGVI